MKLHLKYITVEYDCSNELAEQIYCQFNKEEFEDCYININKLLDDNYKMFINYNFYFKPKYKKIIFVNFQNIRKLYSMSYFNNWMTVVSGFDEIYDIYDQVYEYRPHIQPKVKHIDVKINTELNNYMRRIHGYLSYCDYYNDNIGDHTCSQKDTYENMPIFCDDMYVENLYIGRFCSLGERVRFVLNRQHNYKWISTSLINQKFCQKPRLLYSTFKGDIIIGNDVWIGMDARIMSGVTIGDGAVIGTGAIVTKDIPPYAIVGGVPAKVLKYRFSQDVIEKLLKIKWWDWPLYKVYDNVDLLDSDDMEKFIDKFYEE